MENSNMLKKCNRQINMYDFRKIVVDKKGNGALCYTRARKDRCINS